MDKTIRKFSSFEEMKDEEYRYWQSVPPSERFAAGHQMSVDGTVHMAIPPMEQNLRELLFAFSQHHVRHVILAGNAGFVHAQSRMTKNDDALKT